MECRFNERVTSIMRRKGTVVGVRTDKGGYATPCVVNAAGPWARSLAQSGGLDVPVNPDCHEAGITEPAQRFLEPMVVDIRRTPGAANYYFYQAHSGQVIFCITPDPPLIGTDRRETSEFLPMVARRMVGLMPKLANLKVRRTWRGLYPMTPDGSPVVGRSATLDGLPRRRRHVRAGLHARAGRRRARLPDGDEDADRRRTRRSSTSCGPTGSSRGWRS